MVSKDWDLYLNQVWSVTELSYITYMHIFILRKICFYCFSKCSSLYCCGDFYLSIALKYIELLITDNIRKLGKNIGNFRLRIKKFNAILINYY